MNLSNIRTLPDCSGYQLNQKNGRLMFLQVAQYLPLYLMLSILVLKGF